MIQNPLRSVPLWACMLVCGHQETIGSAVVRYMAHALSLAYGQTEGEDVGRRSMTVAPTRLRKRKKGNGAATRYPRREVG
jgi:hypothetical protein